MNVNRFIQVRDGDALDALRQFLTLWWSRFGLEALLAPVESPDGAAVSLQAIRDPAQLMTVNPFAPIMLGNAAAAVGDFAQQHRGRRTAALLRPCELETLATLREQRRLPASSHDVILLGVDCLATYPLEAYRERLQARGLRGVTHEALTYAAEGGFAPNQFRTSCQVCDWPAPRGAHVIFGVIGVRPESALLVIARDEMTDRQLMLDAVTAGVASEAQVVQREVAVGAVAERRALTREAFYNTPHGQHFADLGTALAWFSSCSLCGDCLDACPLYNGELSGLLGVHGARPPLAEMVNMSRWLASCSGCGMCEAACEQGVPLMQLVGAISRQIQRGLHEVPGHPGHPQPWAASQGGD